MYGSFNVVTDISCGESLSVSMEGLPLCVSVVQSLIAMGISTSLAMLLIRSVFPHPVGPSSITFDFSNREGGFR